uniref:Bm9557 n=1 Tax=Brugia malayi TaxID=6279 RepID=A0A0I9R2X8_BRUMA|nr:Bm9557 [Brugia malayi]
MVLRNSQQSEESTKYAGKDSQATVQQLVAKKNSKQLGKELTETADVLRFAGDLFRKEQPKLQIDQSRFVGEFHNRDDKGDWRVIGMRPVRGNLVTIEYDVMRLYKENASFPEKLSTSDMLPKLLIYFPYPNPRPYFLQEKIQPTLEEIFRMTQFGVLNIGITRDVIIGCIKALRLLHQIGYVHRCVAPYNFAIRLEPFSKMIFQNDLCEQICLTDLTFARKYKDMNKPPRRVTAFTGTYKYCSVSVHNHLEQFPKDDIISCIYMFCEFLQGYLPWKGLKNIKEIVILKRELQMKPPVFMNNTGANRTVIDLGRLRGVFTLLEEIKPYRGLPYLIIYKMLDAIASQHHTVDEGPYELFGISKEMQKRFSRTMEKYDREV